MTAAGHPGHEEVFEGKRAALHVAPEGIALTRRGETPGPPEQYTASYGDVAEVLVKGVFSASVVVRFAHSRDDWVVGGLPHSDAEWARHAIQENARWAQRADESFYSEKLDTPRLTEQLDALLAEPDVDIRALAHALLTQAVLHRASDLHCNATSRGTDIRWRIDGLVTDVTSIPRAVAERLVSRFKVIAGLPTYETQIIQEGHAQFPAEPPVELRFTFMPTAGGETVTVRIFDPERGIIPLAELGMEESHLQAYVDIIEQPDGMIVLTGPAGAGKTTTMYASMQYLNEREGKGLSFATVEDPVEYDLPFLPQTQVRENTNLTFPKALRTVLRQDPNVIMVGEIRDPETAEIAVRAGMTGHLVFTTLHASTPGGVFPRMTEMDVPGFLSASAVRCIVSQRLVRALCKCAREVTQPDPEILTKLDLKSADVAGWDIGEAKGCARCDGSGYIGREGVFQIVPIDDELRELALTDASAPHIDGHLAKMGIETLHAGALKKVARGTTSLQEVVRVLGGRQ